MSSVTPKKQRSIQLKPGSNVVVRAPIDHIHVSEGHVVEVFEGPSRGTKRAAAPFLAGRYRGAAHRAPRGWKAMWDSRPKLIVTSTTKIPSQFLLDLQWKTRRGAWVNQKLEPGEWDARNERDFRNDTIERVKVPPNAKVTLFEHSEFNGRYIDLTEGTHYLDHYGLRGRVSSIKFTLDEWKEVDRRPGRELSKTNVGPAIIRKWRVTGVPGDETEEWVDCGFSESSEEHWDVSATIGISQSITAGGLGVESETTLSVETTAGGGGSKSKDTSQNAGTTVKAVVRDNGRATGSVIFQATDVVSEIIVTLKNERTGEKSEQKKILNARKYESETVFDT